MESWTLSRFTNIWANEREILLEHLDEMDSWRTHFWIEYCRKYWNSLFCHWMTSNQFSMHAQSLYIRWKPMHVPSQTSPWMEWFSPNYQHHKSIRKTSTEKTILITVNVKWSCIGWWKVICSYLQSSEQPVYIPYRLYHDRPKQAAHHTKMQVHWYRKTKIASHRLRCPITNPSQRRLSLR